MNYENDASDRDVVGWTPLPDANRYAVQVAWDREGDSAPFTADVRWDGCVHVRRFHNGASMLDLSGDDVDYLHICDLDEMIVMLTALKQKAREHFGKDWS